jgi:hypothetical protein
MDSHSCFIDIPHPKGQPKIKSSREFAKHPVCLIAQRPYVRCGRGPLFLIEMSREDDHTLYRITMIKFTDSWFHKLYS